MYFQVKKLVLWPRADFEPRIVNFLPGAVNVISGASKTGKSAVIPIIDYCLGAEKCAIPVGVIRESCAWFGILIDTIEGEKLLARREPKDQQSTGDMFLIEGINVEVPHRLDDKNTNAEAVKAMLNRLSGLTALEFEPATDSGFKQRPSFRDLMAFTFQPQNIVANPDVVFFKADTTEHREKLKTIFPYVLGAVTSRTLQARWELDRLQRILRRKEADLTSMIAGTVGWQREAVAWIRQAMELGLIEADREIPREWADIVDLLRHIVLIDPRNAAPNIAGLEATLGRLEVLREEESEVSSALSEHRQRLNELRRLLESSEAYGDGIRIQRDRLALSSWLRDLVQQDTDAIGELAASAEHLTTLCGELERIEFQLRTYPSMSDTLDKEVLRHRSAAERTLERLNIVRREIIGLEQASEEVRAETYRSDNTQRFLGRLEQALELYGAIDQSSDLRQEIESLRHQIEELQATVSENEIRRRLRNALDQIQATTTRLIPQLDAEWPDAPIRLIVEDLSVKVIRGSRDDYLWEIGSGANWLAYHITLTLALQRFFQLTPHHPVPALLIYDQPSQVYFPRRAAGDDAIDTALKDEDVAAVRKVFALLGREVATANGRMQIIVLDHASDNVWGGLPNVELTEEWRGDRKLVPEAWAR